MSGQRGFSRGGGSEHTQAETCTVLPVWGGRRGIQGRQQPPSLCAGATIPGPTGKARQGRSCLLCQYLGGGRQVGTQRPSGCCPMTQEELGAPWRTLPARDPRIHCHPGCPGACGSPLGSEACFLKIWKAVLLLALVGRATARLLSSTPEAGYRCPQQGIISHGGCFVLHAGSADVGIP